MVNVTASNVILVSISSEIIGIFSLLLIINYLLLFYIIILLIIYYFDVTKY